MTTPHLVVSDQNALREEETQRPRAKRATARFTQRALPNTIRFAATNRFFMPRPAAKASVRLQPTEHDCCIKPVPQSSCDPTHCRQYVASSVCCSWETFEHKTSSSM